MTDIECIQSQNDEFKALSFIYLNEFQVIKETNPQKFVVNCKPYIGNQFEYQINLMFEFSQSYPKTPLKYQIQPLAGITRDNLIAITNKIQDIIYENRDKPIVYDIIEQTRSWIHEYLVLGKAYQAQDLVVEKKQEIFERPKFAAFTPVTVESFLAWKKQFDEKNKAKKIVKKDQEQKMTGKEWFLGKKEDEIEQSDQEDEEDYQDEQEEEEEEKVQIPTQQNNDLFDV